MEGLISIGLLAALAGGMAFAYARATARAAKHKTNLKVLEGQIDGIEREDKAIADHERVGDLADDARFLPDNDRTS